MHSQGACARIMPQSFIYWCLFDIKMKTKFEGDVTHEPQGAIIIMLQLVLYSPCLFLCSSRCMLLWKAPLSWLLCPVVGLYVWKDMPTQYHSHAKINQLYRCVVDVMKVKAKLEHTCGIQVFM